MRASKALLGSASSGAETPRAAADDLRAERHGRVNRRARGSDRVWRPAAWAFTGKDAVAVGQGSVHRVLCTTGSLRR